MHDAQPLPHDCSGSKYTPCPTVGWHTCMHALNITHTRGHMHARAHTPPYTHKHTHAATHMYRLYMKVCKVWHCVHVRVCVCLWACLWARVCVCIGWSSGCHGDDQFRQAIERHGIILNPGSGIHDQKLSIHWQSYNLCLLYTQRLFTRHINTFTTMCVGTRSKPNNGRRRLRWI